MSQAGGIEMRCGGNKLSWRKIFLVPSSHSYLLAILPSGTKRRPTKSFSDDAFNIHFLCHVRSTHNYLYL
jgi:hypothetical protein